MIFYMLFLRNESAGRIVDGAVPWRVYLMVSMCSFGALVAALNAGGSRLSTERASGWARQLRVTPIPAWSYVTTKVAASMLVVLPVVVLVELVGMAFGGVSSRRSVGSSSPGLLWVTALPFAILGIFVGFMVNAETAYPVVTALMFVLGYFGGLFNPVSHMPHVLQTTARSSSELPPDVDRPGPPGRPGLRNSRRLGAGGLCRRARVAPSCGSTGSRRPVASPEG